VEWKKIFSHPAMSRVLGESGRGKALVLCGVDKAEKQA